MTPLPIVDTDDGPAVEIVVPVRVHFPVAYLDATTAKYERMAWLESARAASDLRRQIRQLLDEERLRR